MMSSNSGQRRYDTTNQKTIYLTGVGWEKIEAWGRANNLNFSAAIETLALAGLEDESVAYHIPLLRTTTMQAMQLVFNRFASLLSDIAIEAAIARTMSEGLMLQWIREAAEDDPDDFEQTMRVQRNGRSQKDKRIRAFHDAIKENAEHEAIRRMKKAIGRMEALFFEEEP
jgi:hypothetical protein